MTADSDLFSAHPLRRPPTSSNYNKEVNKYYELDFRSLEKEKGNTSRTDGLTHSIQKHPATFIPQIPRYLIETYLDSEEEQLVADIFSGSGTTGVEAVSHGHSYLGIEVNPLSVLVSRVATHPYPKEILNEALSEFCSLSAPEKTEDVKFPGRTNKLHWFEEKANADLTRIVHKLERFYEEYIESEYFSIPSSVQKKLPYTGTEIHTHIWDFFVLVFTNTVFEVSNADPGVSKAYKSPKMKEKIENGVHPPDVNKSFLSEFESVKQKVDSLWEQTVSYNKTIPESTILYGDVRTVDLSGMNADLIVSSPPYINAINYYRGSKLRLFWATRLLEKEMEFDAYNVRKEIIGSESSVSTTNIAVDEPCLIKDIWTCDDTEFNRTSLPRLDEQLEEIQKADLNNASKLSHLTWTFFAEDMAQSLETAYNNLSKDGLLFYIIGENTVGGQYIETKDYIKDVAENLGCFSTTSITNGFMTKGIAFDEITNRELFQTRNHENGVIECEWVLAFSK